MSVDCNVIFENNPEKIYFSGQTVKAIAIINIHQQLKVKSTY
jgi:hypothetical protein